MPIRFISHRRAVEWLSTAIMFWIGLIWLHPYPHFSVSTLETSGRLLNVLTEPVWGTLLILLACVRAAALVINGRSPRGSPVARIGCAVVGTTIFSWIAFAFAATWPAGAWNAGVYAILAIYEIFTVYRATRDLRGAVDAA